MHRWSRLAANWSSYQLHHPKRQVSPLLILISLKNPLPPFFILAPLKLCCQISPTSPGLQFRFLACMNICLRKKFRFMWWNQCRHPERIHFHLVLPPKLRSRVKPLKAFFRNVNIEIPRCDFIFLGVPVFSCSLYSGFWSSSLLCKLKVGTHPMKFVSRCVWIKCLN